MWSRGELWDQTESLVVEVDWSSLGIYVTSVRSEKGVYRQTLSATSNGCRRELNCFDAHTAYCAWKGLVQGRFQEQCVYL